MCKYFLERKTENKPKNPKTKNKIKCMNFFFFLIVCIFTDGNQPAGEAEGYDRQNVSFPGLQESLLKQICNVISFLFCFVCGR